MAKARRKPFEIAGNSIPAGTRTTFELPIPDLYIHTDLSMPVHVVHGRKDGPVMFLSGAIHGDEIMGVEIIRRVLMSKRLANLRGTLIAVPVVNMFGFISQSRYLPDRRDLNRCFPGSGTGSIASRLAHVFISEIVTHCDYGIDLHTAAVNRENLPQVRANMEDEDANMLARAFGLPVVLSSGLIEGSLRKAAMDENVKVIVYEAGEALRFDETAIRGGVHGVHRVLQRLGMLSKRERPAKRKLREPTVALGSRWVRAPQSGIHRSMSGLGINVKKGDTLGWIADPLGENSTPVLALQSGIIIGRSNLPLVTEGEALFHIATFEGPDEQIARQIDNVEAALDNVSEELLMNEPPIV